jgi:hypothetical protein
VTGVRPLTCPRCAQSDQIRKVSTIVREGTASGTTSYGSVATRTNLAAQLTMPGPLQMNRSLGSEIGCGIGVAFILWVIVGSIFAVLKLIPLAAILDVLLAIGLIRWIIVSSRRFADEKAQIAAQNRLYPGMEHAWNRLYYCFRDDIVFFDNDPLGNAPASEMVRLLIDESAKQASLCSLPRGYRLGRDLVASRTSRREPTTAMHQQGAVA